MSIEKRERRNGRGEVYTRWIIDVVAARPDGSKQRVRIDSPVQTKRGAEQFQQQVRHEIMNGTFGKVARDPAPILRDFQSRFIEEWCEANKQKPSGIEGKQSAFRNHLLPLFGDRRLDSFSASDEDKLKRRLKANQPATYNNIASVMNSVLKTAERWKLVEKVPHHFQLLKRQKPKMRFYDFEQFGWLQAAARQLDARIYLTVLLGGDAGLRRGEIMALEWSDVDLKRGFLTVERSAWKGEVTGTKGLETREIPLTKRLADALREARHLRGQRVLYTDAGDPVTAKVLHKWMTKAQAKAQLRATGGIHILRHTFCSHLAMKGAPALSIQRLAGHQDLSTTLGYMHLVKGEPERAISLLEQPHQQTDTAEERRTDVSA